MQCDVLTSLQTLRKIASFRLALSSETVNVLVLILSRLSTNENRIINAKVSLPILFYTCQDSALFDFSSILFLFFKFKVCLMSFARNALYSVTWFSGCLYIKLKKKSNYGYIYLSSTTCNHSDKLSVLNVEPPAK